MYAIIKEIIMAFVPYGIVRIITLAPRPQGGGGVRRVLGILREIIKAIIPYGIARVINLNPRRVTKKRLANACADMKPKTELKDVFGDIYAQNTWNSGKSRSGPGSEMHATRNIRKALPKLWEEYGVKTFLDVPCGDYYWMNTVDKGGITYIGGDIVEEAVERNNRQYGGEGVSFIKIDITKDDLPRADMILCRDCLQHLSLLNVGKALQQFKRSGAKYLLATSYPLTAKNWDVPDGGYRPLNLLIEPFNMPPPLRTIRDGIIGGEIDRGVHLFEIDKIASAN